MNNSINIGISGNQTCDSFLVKITDDHIRLQVSGLLEEIEVKWMYLDSPEHLADLLGDVRVRTFKEIIRVLGTVFENKERYLDVYRTLIK